MLLMKFKQVNKNNGFKAQAFNHIEDEYNAYIEKLKYKNVDTIIDQKNIYFKSNYLKQVILCKFSLVCL